MARAVEIGVGTDSVAIILNGERLLVAETYEVQMSMLQQPAAFAARLGHGYMAADLMRKYPPNTPFELYIGGRKFFTGRTDGYTAEGSSGATEVCIRGRDALGPLHDAYARAEKSFSDVSYAQLVEKVLDEALEGRPYTLLFSADANRSAITGSKSGGSTTKAKESFLAFVSGGHIGTQAGAKFVPGDPPPKSSTLQVKMGERWLDGFLKKELDRAGLFLWALADGSFVLARPDATQAPSFRLTRRRAVTGSLSRNVSNILRGSHRNETTGRYNRVDIHCRAGGGSESRVKGVGTYLDREMFSYGYAKCFCAKDDKATTIFQAEYLAKRKVAECRRSGWSLNYTVSGHTADGPGGKNLVWAPDTMVEVDDEEFGISGNFYLEGVTHRTNPQAETELVLMRPEDVVYGDESDTVEPTSGFKGTPVPKKGSAFAFISSSSQTAIDRLLKAAT